MMTMMSGEAFYVGIGWPPYRVLGLQRMQRLMLGIKPTDFIPLFDMQMKDMA